MCVNAIPFLHTASQHVKLRTSKCLKSREKEKLMLGVKGAMNVHSRNGFSVEEMDGDLEFQCVKNEFSPPIENIADADAHVHPIKRSIRTAKEKIRCTIQGLSFSCVPKEMMKALPAHVMRIFNKLLVKSSVSKGMSPLSIITRVPRPDYNNLKLEFEERVEAHEDKKLSWNPHHYPMP